MVERLCDFITGVQSEDGRLGKAWYNDGTCSDQDGTAGCYLASGLCGALQSSRSRNMDSDKKGI